MSLDSEVSNLIENFGFASVIAAIARYAHHPRRQDYSVRAMATVFRKLNGVYEYLLKQ